MDVAVDIHYSKLLQWLADRSGELRKRLKTEFDTVVSQSSELVALARFELPQLIKDIARANSAFGEAARNCARNLAADQRRVAKRSAMLAALGLPELVDDVESSLWLHVFRTRNEFSEKVQACVRDSDVQAALAYVRGELTNDETLETVFPWLCAFADQRLSVRDADEYESLLPTDGVVPVEITPRQLLSAKVRNALLEEVLAIEAFVQERLRKKPFSHHSSLPGVATLREALLCTEAELIAASDGHVAHWLSEYRHLDDAYVSDVRTQNLEEHDARLNALRQEFETRRNHMRTIQRSIEATLGEALHRDVCVVGDINRL
jgi:hypothetical protein